MYAATSGLLDIYRSLLVSPTHTSLSNDLSAIQTIVHAAKQQAGRLELRYRYTNTSLF